MIGLSVPQYGGSAIILDLAARTIEPTYVRGAGIEFLVSVFLPQRAPLAPLWSLRAHWNNTFFYYLPASLLHFF